MHWKKAKIFWQLQGENYNHDEVDWDHEAGEDKAVLKHLISIRFVRPRRK